MAMHGRTNCVSLRYLVSTGHDAPDPAQPSTFALKRLLIVSGCALVLRPCREVHKMCIVTADFELRCSNAALQSRLPVILLYRFEPIVVIGHAYEYSKSSCSL